MNIIKKLCLYMWIAMCSILRAAEPQELTVTIYAHGTQPGILARHKFFYRKPGMHRIEAYKPKHHKREIAHILAKADADMFDLDHYYIYGWSGKLSVTERARAAEQFLQDLRALLAAYATQGYTHIKLRIITHSHGGNIVLRLASLADKDEFVIDELIMLACPIVPETKDLHKHPMFKKVYAFYSTKDIMQVADKFAHARGRSFAPAPNTVQASIQIKKKAIWHLLTHACFTTKTFLRHLPRVCAVADAYYAERDAATVETPPTIVIKRTSNDYTIRAV
jgi:hypothetical protein